MNTKTTGNTLIDGLVMQQNANSIRTTNKQLRNAPPDHTALYLLSGLLLVGLLFTTMKNINK